MIKQERHIFKGIQRDLSVSKFSAEFAYDARNIRLTARDSNNLLSATNERGTLEIPIEWQSKDITTINDYNILGYAVLNQYLVLFIQYINLDIYYDAIIRLELNSTGTKFKGIKLYDCAGDNIKGALNFNIKNPIETLVFYENEEVQKVYWVDGLNPIRFINIAASQDKIDNFNSSSFDFLQDLNLQEKVVIEQNKNLVGQFPNGTVQYVMTYYNKFGSESNIIYTSPLYYTYMIDRGGSPEEKASGGFNISINSVDYRFEYLRIYSIIRTSENGTPVVKIVKDLKINKDFYNHPIKGSLISHENLNVNNTFIIKDKLFNKVDLEIKIGDNIIPDGYIIEEYDNVNTQPINTYIAGNNTILKYSVKTISAGNIEVTKVLEDFYSTTGTRKAVKIHNIIDLNTTGETVDSSILLYIGGKNLIPSTMTSKDNTLFLGNIKNEDNDITQELKDYIIQNSYVDFQYFPRHENTTDTLYNYVLQLDKSSRQLKHFKGGETYRIGIQFKDNKGVYTQPLYIGDYKNIKYINSEETVKLVYLLPYNNILSKYKQARLVMVSPTNNDRSVIAQGILCPTVFNIEDRYSNSPFAQSSWFTRPLQFYNQDGVKKHYDASTHFAPIEEEINIHYEADNYDIMFKKGEFTHSFTYTLSYGCIKVFNTDVYLIVLRDNQANKNILSEKGTYNRVRDILIKYIPEEEIPSEQEMYNTNDELTDKVVTFLTQTKGDIDLREHTYKYYVDQSILTLHSPDIDFNVDSIKDIKLRIIGIQEQQSTLSDYYINANIGRSPASRVVKYNYSDNQFGYFSYRPVYNDSMKESGQFTNYLVYPWHRNGSLNSDSNGETAKLNKKIISNISYFNNINLLRKPWEAYIKDDNKHTGITNAKLFNSDSIIALELDTPQNSLDQVNKYIYYGNIDKVITPKSTPYPLYNTGNVFIDSNSDILEPTKESNATSSNPVSMKYKSTPHYVFSLNCTKDNISNLLPYVYDTYQFEETNGTPIWRNSKEGHSNIFNRDEFTEDNFFNPLYKYGTKYVYIAELYKDIPTEVLYGGNTEEAINKNTWIPISDDISIIENQPLAIYNTEGDTYYQRYDCLRTYAYTEEDQNQIIDIASFMIETRKNIDGRYDKNRGDVSNFSINPTNFNLFNNVYNQENNYFNYHILDKEIFKSNYFPNTITWTKEKHIASQLDEWTNITFASTLDMDGDKGQITSLNTFNNEIYCFQESSLSNILFNSRVQIPTSDGVPIEITNGLKVQGKRYISNNIGCQNKWSIVETSNGLYFMDNNTSSIYLFNGQISSITDKLGFKSWMNEVNNYNIWNPIDYSNFRTFYDKGNDDVYFINKDNCLCYSEYLQQFTSFMSYEKVHIMFNIGSELYSFKKGKLWQNNAGEYNMFYDEFKPYSITFISNDNAPYDKIYNNLDYRADNWNKDEEGNYILSNNTFSTLEIWNEYQKGILSLNNIKDKPSSLKRKFRVWRTIIPRFNTDWNGIKANNRDRIRNTWAYIKLSNDIDNTDKMEFHDAIVSYFI